MLRNRKALLAAPVRGGHLATSADHIVGECRQVFEMDQDLDLEGVSPSVSRNRMRRTQFETDPTLQKVVPADLFKRGADRDFGVERPCGTGQAKPQPIARRDRPVDRQV